MQKNFTIKKDIGLMWDELVLRIKLRKEDPNLSEQQIFSDFVTELYNTLIIQGELDDGEN